MQTRLFVYGTLAPDKPNEHLLKGLPGTWQVASVRGRLVSSGWGADLGYPGMILDEEGPEVSGLLFTSPGLPGFWKQLDEFEGQDYIRVQTPATLKNGQKIEAFVYVLRSS